MNKPTAPKRGVFQRRDATQTAAAVAAMVAEPNQTPIQQAAAAVADGVEPAQVGSANPFPVGKIVELHPSEVRRNPRNARRFVSPTKLNELGQAIQEQGQIQAALAYFKDGIVQLIDGDRRWQACVSIGKKLRVEIVEAPEGDRALYKSSRGANKNREDNSPLDDCFVWTDLLDQGVYASQKELAADIGVDDTVVSRTLSLKTIPQSLIPMLVDHDEIIGNFRMLDQIAQYAKAAGEDSLALTEKLIHEIIQNKLASRDVEKRRTALGKAKQTRTRAAAHTLEFVECKAEVKLNKEKGQLSFNIHGTKDGADLGELQEKIEDLLKGYFKPKSAEATAE